MYTPFRILLPLSLHTYFFPYTFYLIHTSHILFIRSTPSQILFIIPLLPYTSYLSILSHILLILIFTSHKLFIPFTFYSIYTSQDILTMIYNSYPCTRALLPIYFVSLYTLNIYFFLYIYTSHILLYP